MVVTFADALFRGLVVGDMWGPYDGGADCPRVETTDAGYVQVDKTVGS